MARLVDLMDEGRPSIRARRVRAVTERTVGGKQAGTGLPVLGQLRNRNRIVRPVHPPCPCREQNGGKHSETHRRRLDPPTPGRTRPAAPGCAPSRTPGTAHVAAPGLAAAFRAVVFAESLAPRGMKSMATQRVCAFGRTSRTRARTGSRPFGSRVEGHTRRQRNLAVDGLVRQKKGLRDAHTVPVRCLESDVIPCPLVEGVAQSLERCPAGLCRSRCLDRARSRRTGNPDWTLSTREKFNGASADLTLSLPVTGGSSIARVRRDSSSLAPGAKLERELSRATGAEIYMPPEVAEALEIARRGAKMPAYPESSAGAKR